MSNFIVLGIIPGTNIQIGFAGWLAIFAGTALLLFGVHWIRKTQILRYLLLRVSLAQSVKSATTAHQEQA